MRVSFDSNAWEQIFRDEVPSTHCVHGALIEGRAEGFICVTGFGIEAIQKIRRAAYFSRPYINTEVEITGGVGINSQIKMSIGPDHFKHPGLPDVQRRRLSRAFTCGIKLMYGQNWWGLPLPSEVKNAD